VNQPSPPSGAACRLPLIVAIDGPAGSGKSTAARNLARAEGLAYLNTGAMYRAVTHLVMEGGIDAERDPEQVAEVARRMDFRYGFEDDEPRFWVAPQPGGKLLDLTPVLFTAALTQKLKPVVNNPGVRAAVVEKTRAAARELTAQGRRGVVLEGRDTGTVIFPEAFLKVYLRADLEERARRRAAELRQRGEQVREDGLRGQIEYRDTIDVTRVIGPLKQAPDAFEVDTTHRQPEETLAILRRELARRLREAQGLGSKEGRS
jgi:cytidylate kinase